MAMSLKEAMLKAGLKETAKPKDENFRPKVPKQQRTETVSHQKQRNFCEECQQTKPDVEFYEHRNPTTTAEWICLRCVDQLKIPDTFRRTAQSDTAIKRVFRREFGMTMNFQSFQKPADKPKK